LSESLKHRHPLSVLIDEGQQEGDEALFAKSIDGEDPSIGAGPLGSVVNHPAATPGKDTPS
jgi:hypothetical protein